MEPQTVATYNVVDSRTGVVMRAYKVANAYEQRRMRNNAGRYADKLDNQYGAHRYSVQPVWMDKE